METMHIINDAWQTLTIMTGTVSKLQRALQLFMQQDVKGKTFQGRQKEVSDQLYLAIVLLDLPDYKDEDDSEDQNSTPKSNDQDGQRDCQPALVQAPPACRGHIA